MDSNTRISDNLDALRRRQSPCVLCPRGCAVSREPGHLGYCRAPRKLLVAEAVLHFGEERPLIGTGGSGTIFLAGCNLRCVFCQNGPISHDTAGKPWDVDDLVYAMLRLARQGCENINFVTPTHYAPQIAEAIAESRHRGLAVPIVYNCGGYESVETLRLLEDLVDIYMPDIKFWSAERGQRYADAPDYADVVRAAILEMHRQVGELTIIGERAARGLLVRHLVIPGGIDEGHMILDWLAESVSPATYVNIMGQYRPLLRAAEFPEINRRATDDEVAELRAHVKRLGLRLAE